MHNCDMKTAVRKPREQRITAICHQQVEPLRQCHSEYQHISETWPGSSDVSASNLSEVLDAKMLN
jgi:hypothetical protein